MQRSEGDPVAPNLSSLRREPRRRPPATSRRSSRRGAATVALVIAVLAGRPVLAQTVVNDPLPYSLSYTITGNYVVGSVDFEPVSNQLEFQTATLHMAGASAIPAGAEIVAAWLYWETIWGDPDEVGGAKFRGQDIELVRGADQVLTGALAPCWSGGGDTLTMLRADVLDLLPLEIDAANGNPTGRRLVNDVDLLAAGLPLSEVTLPERGSGNHTPQSAGASLLVIYRLPTEPLRRIVVFDGNRVLAQGQSSVQRVRGFFDSSATSASGARLTYLAASGAPNDSERLFLGASATPLVTDPFFPAGGGTSDRAWSSSRGRSPKAWASTSRRARSWRGSFRTARPGRPACSRATSSSR